MTDSSDLSCWEYGQYSKMITLHGNVSAGYVVSIPMDLGRERFRRDNLTANGCRPSTPSSNWT